MKRVWIGLALLVVIAGGVALTLWLRKPAHDFKVTGLAFHGDSLISTGYSDDVKVWNLASRKVTREASFRWSSTDKLCLLGSSGRIILGGIGSEGGLRLGTIAGEFKFLDGGDRWIDRCVLAAHEGLNRIVVGYPEPRRELAAILDLGTGRWQEVERTGEADVTSILFSTDGKSIVGGLNSGVVQLIDLATRKKQEVAALKAEISAILPVPSKPDQVVVALRPRGSGYFVQDSKTGAILGPGDCTLWTVTLPKGEAAPVGTFTGPVDSIAQSVDGRFLSWASVGGSVMLLDRSTGRQTAVVPPGVSKEVTSMAFSPDGKHLAIGRWDGRLQLWSLPELQGRELR